MVKSAKYLLIYFIIMLRLVAIKCQTIEEAGEDAYLCKKPDNFENPPKLVECIKIETFDTETIGRLAKRNGHDDESLKMRIYVPFRVFQKMYNDILRQNEREENAFFRTRAYK